MIKHSLKQTTVGDKKKKKKFKICLAKLTAQAVITDVYLLVRAIPHQGPPEVAVPIFTFFS